MAIATRRWLHQTLLLISLDRQVSTHSRPKAAARDKLCTLDITQSFNTQPLEGGCMGCYRLSDQAAVSTHSRSKAAAWAVIAYQTKLPFQHTAARRRLPLDLCELPERYTVSTHSRPKTAALWQGLG